MIEIIGTAINQWDSGRSVKVTDVEASHVHFANQGDSKAAVMELVDSQAPIPDYLLQTGKRLCVYAVANGVTVESRVFPVKKRERPADYVYDYDQRDYIYELIQSAEEATAEANRVAEELQTAKENGEFTGPQGPRGPQGNPGYTPVRGKDYWTEEDQYAIRQEVVPVIVFHGDDNKCNYNASVIYEMAEALLNGDSANTIWLFWRGTWLIPYSGTDEHLNACFERTFVDEDGKPVLVSFRIDKDGWLTRTDTYLPVVNDTKVGEDVWSSKNIVDKLCPSFEKSGYIVTCEPVEGYPVTVTSDETSSTFTRCGKNLLDLSEGNVKAINWIRDGGAVSDDFWGVELILPPGTYTIKAAGSSGDYIYAQANDLARTKYLKPFAKQPVAGGQPNAAQTVTFTEWMWLYIFESNVPISGGQKKTTVVNIFNKYNVQLEVGNTATAFEPYNGEEFSFTREDGIAKATVPALPGVNTFISEVDGITVTGKSDPVAIINKLTNKEE